MAGNLPAGDGTDPSFRRSEDSVKWLTAGKPAAILVRHAATLLAAVLLIALGLPEACVEALRGAHGDKLFVW